MSDNVNITPGTGNTVAADEVIDATLGTVKVQYVKLMDGTIDGTTKAVVDANGIKVNGSGVTQPISAASLPLPSGASTSANQTNGNQITQLADGAGHSLNIDPSGTARVNVVTPSTFPISGSVSVSNFPATQPVSGSVSVSNFPATQPISAVSLPLPLGASQDTTLTGGTAKTQIVDSGGNVQAIGSVSKASYSELIDSSGKLVGSTKVIFTLTATNFTGATTEGMITLTPIRDGVVGTTGTSFTITSGKRFRLLGVSVLTKNAAAATQGILVRVRINPSGAVIVTSPILLSIAAGTSIAIANNTGCNEVGLGTGDLAGLELKDTFQIGISQIGTATAGNDVSIWGYEY